MSPHRSALPMETRFRYLQRGGKTNKRTFKAIKRYVTGPGTTTEMVTLLVIAAAIWLANLHFHWFQ
jgi:hypothetical protein